MTGNAEMNLSVISAAQEMCTVSTQVIAIYAQPVTTHALPHNSALSCQVVVAKCSDPHRDGGYWGTARMLLESGLCLALDGDKLKQVRAFLGQQQHNAAC